MKIPSFYNDHLAKMFPEGSTVGVKYDQDKLRYDLLPPDALEAITSVYTMGAKKYADRNWEGGMEWMRIVGALLRHLFKWLRGERYDKENGQPHLASVAWNAICLLTYEERGIGTDDRPRAAFYGEGNRERSSSDSGELAGPVEPKPEPLRPSAGEGSGPGSAVWGGLVGGLGGYNLVANPERGELRGGHDLRAGVVQ